MTKSRHFYSKKHFLDKLCERNDDGEFGRSICVIYQKELSLKSDFRRPKDFFDLDQ